MLVDEKDDVSVVVLVVWKDEMLVDVMVVN